MIKSYFACIPGPYHIEEKVPCQDSCFIHKDERGFAVAAVADGVGSQKFSDTGSRIAAKTAVKYCVKEYSPGMEDEDAEELLEDAFGAALFAVFNEARRKNLPVTECDTTLTLVILDHGRLYYCQAGDSGAVALLKTGEILPVTKPQGDGNLVYPLRSMETWVSGKFEGEVSAVMLVTDGLWNGVLFPKLIETQGKKLNTAFAMDLLARTEEKPKEIAKLQNGARKLLWDIDPMAVYDDKTLAVLYDTDIPAEKLDEEYYAPVDWEKLAEAKLDLIYGKGLKQYETELEHGAEQFEHAAESDEHANEEI